MKLANNSIFAPLIWAVLAVFFVAGCGREEPAPSPSAPPGVDAAYVESLKKMQLDQRRLAARHAELKQKLEALGTDAAHAAERAQLEKELAAVGQEAARAQKAARAAVRARLAKQNPAGGAKK